MTIEHPTQYAHSQPNGTLLWIKDPAGIHTSSRDNADASRGLVVDTGTGVITEIEGAGAAPAHYNQVFDAAAHVMLLGLVNTHHHFYQTLTRAWAPVADAELFPWLQGLYPVWARLTPAALESAVTVAVAELLISGCTTAADHHYVFPTGMEESGCILTWPKPLTRKTSAANASACAPWAISNPWVGSPVGLGVDGSASNDGSNMIEEVRAALNIQRLSAGPSRVPGSRVLNWATRGSAGALGWDSIGVLEPGARADIAMFTRDELRFAGSHDPVASLVLCGAHRADRVMVDGHWVVEGGCLPGLDLERVIARQKEQAGFLMRD